MHSTKSVVASLVLLLTGLVPAITKAQLEGTQKDNGPAVVTAKEVNVANSLGGTPAASSSSSVVYFDSKEVAAAFARGNPSVLYQGPGYANAKGGASNYEIHTSRVEGPDVPELHTTDTDIYFVLEGTMTMVTGGTIVNPKTISPNQIRGTDIKGGETRQLSKGEVMIIPHGVPHWHKEVPGTFVYLVVKIR